MPVSMFSAANHVVWSMVYWSAASQWIMMSALFLAASIGAARWRRHIDSRTILRTVFTATSAQATKTELAVMPARPRKRRPVQTSTVGEVRLLPGETVALKVLRPARGERPWVMGEVLEVSGRDIVLNLAHVLLPDSPVEVSWANNFILGTVHYCIADHLKGGYRIVVHGHCGVYRLGKGTDDRDKAA